MLLRSIPYHGHEIHVYRFGSQVFFYPSFNGNYESTDYHSVCSYIRTVNYFGRMVEKTLTASTQY